ncbi:hypothetical protein GCM10027299_32840 [Larkinella ripae]
MSQDPDGFCNLGSIIFDYTTPRMSLKEGKQNRKKLVQNFKRQEKESNVAGMPISTADLKSLFDYLDDKLQKDDCDDSLSLTEAFLKERGLPMDQVKAWLSKYGGCCDCEVLANVEDEFEGIV